MESLSSFPYQQTKGFLGCFERSDWENILRILLRDWLVAGWTRYLPLRPRFLHRKMRKVNILETSTYLQTQNLNFARFSQKCRKACHKFPYQFRYSFTTVIHGWSQGTTFTFWNKSSCTPTITANPTEFASNSLAFDSPHQACNLLIGTKDDHTWKWKEYILESHTSVTFISFVDGSVRLAWFFVPLSWQKRTL